jgi:hypothetical protein
VGLLFIGAGFVTLVWRLHDRSIHEAIAVLRNSSHNVGSSISAFVGVLAPTVTAIAIGVAFVRVAAMGW